MKYFLIAGEQSGDLHGSNLIRELKSTDPDAEIRCWGGDLMEDAGAKLLRHYRDTAFMGFVVILKNLKTISENLEQCKKDISEFSPDVVILIDYPGFNLRIAQFARGEGFKVFYYISPKFWAWNEKRVEKVKKYVDRMYIIFPFETAFYAKHGIETSYRGNPVVDEIERRKKVFPDETTIRKELNLNGKPIIALLAGSRRHEVESILPQMVKVLSSFPEYQFVLACVKNLPLSLYEGIIGDNPVKLVVDKTYEVLSVSEAALVASGTATLETALFNVPQVVCYKGDFFSMLIAWIVIKVKYISLVNLILEKEAVREVLGYDVNKVNITNELKAVLTGGRKRENMLADYGLLRQKLGPSGASERVAKDMINHLI